jgi:sulfhydrogenase subunit beta (sulfur reductase)
MQSGEKHIVDKQQFLHHLALVAQKTTVIGPCRMPDGDVTFQPIKKIEDITFDYVNELYPLKRFFTPAFEKLFDFDRRSAKPMLHAPEKPEAQILFGARSCDVQGIHHMDGFFRGAFYDNAYLDRREATTVISIACNKPLNTCFCICCNAGPSLSTGFDLQLTDFGDRFLVDVGSEKGAALLQNINTTTAGEADQEHRKALMQACDEKMIPTAYLAKAVIAITNNRVREELWEEMGSECFSCGGCTHVCPCCTCFDVSDDIYPDQTGMRYRCWDSCQYSGFTREASGHNPRAKSKERVKRRFYHKLSFAYIQQDGHPGCVGCGRCITVCQAFGLLDIAAVVKRLRRDGQIKEAEKKTI